MSSPAHNMIQSRGNVFLTLPNTRIESNSRYSFTVKIVITNEVSTWMKKDMERSEDYDYEDKDGHR